MGIRGDRLSPRPRRTLSRFWVRLTCYIASSSLSSSAAWWGRSPPSLLATPPDHYGDALGSTLGGLVAFVRAYPIAAGALVALVIAIMVVGGRIEADVEAREKAANERRIQEIAEAAARAEYQRLGAGAPAAPLAPPFDEGLLPRPRPFIGRADDLAWVMDHLARGGVSAIAAVGGLAGIGKTALAAEAVAQLRAAGRFADGVAVVGAQGQLDARALLREALARFDPEVPEGADLPLLARETHRLLDGKDALVVFDNAEPGLMVQQLQGPLGATGAALLLTARQAFAALPPDATRRLELLPLAEALALFAQWLGRAPAGTEGEVARAIVEGELGRHTLAVKLVGAYARGRDLAAVARELKDPRRALALRLPDVPDEVQAAFATSYAALDEDTRRLFAALAAFPPSATDLGREAVLALARGSGARDPERSVALLVERALADAATNDAMPQDSDRERLRLHPLVRAYADLLGGRLPRRTRATAALALASFYADYANATPDEALVPDEASIAGALEWAHTHRRGRLIARLCDGMRDYWRDRSETAERRRYLPWGLAAARRRAFWTRRRAERLRLARLQLAYGELLLTLGQTREAERYFRRSLAIQRRAGDERGAAIALSYLGDILLQRGDLAGAQANFERFLQIMRQVGDQREEGVALAALGDLLVQQGDVAGAQANYERYLQIMRQVGDRQQEGVALYKLALILEKNGDLDQAEDYHRKSLAIAIGVQATQDIADSYAYLGAFLIEQRNKREEGCGMLAEAARRYDAMGMPGGDKARAKAEELGCG